MVDFCVSDRSTLLYNTDAKSAAGQSQTEQEDKDKTRSGKGRVDFTSRLRTVFEEKCPDFSLLSSLLHFCTVLHA